MKTVNRVLVLMLLCSMFALVSCTNTAHGFHEDWRSNMQSMANSTGN